MIQHNKWFYTEYNGVKYKIKVTNRAFSYATLRIRKLWKFGLYLPFIYDARELKSDMSPITRKAYYEEDFIRNRVKYVLENLYVPAIKHTEYLEL